MASTSIGRFRSEILTSGGINEIARAISGKINRKLNPLELKTIYNFTDGHKGANWTRVSTDDIIKIIATNFVKKYFTPAGRAETKEEKGGGPVDMHETLKKAITQIDGDDDYDKVDINGLPITRTIKSVDPDIAPLGSLDAIKSVASVGRIDDVTKLFGLSDRSRIQALFNPAAGYRSNYIYMDSRNRLTGNDGTTFFQWNFLNNSSVSTQGAVNSLGTVKNVIQMSIPKIRIPYQDSVFISSSRRVTMLIKEFATQAFIGPQLNFHFIFEAVADGNMIDLIPLLGKDYTGIFRFEKPITQIDTLTVSFGNPQEPIRFDPDSQFVTVDYSSADSATFTTVGGVPHNLKTPDQVYFTSFTTADPIGDQAIIDSVNYIYGHNIYVIDEYSFQIDGIDLTTIAVPAAGPFLVYYGSKRVQIPIELTFISSTGTSVAE